jgi:hypothetical protein
LIEEGKVIEAEIILAGEGRGKAGTGVRKKLD